MYIEFKPGKKYPSKNAMTSESIEDFNDCGYLLTENEVVVDIDHLPKDVIRKFIEEFRIDTQVVWTERGAHLYFEKPDKFKRREGVVPLGFDVEYKTSTNCKGGITIKRDGKVREIENEGKRQLLPFCLTSRYGSKAYKNLQGMGDGDGRNNALESLKRKIYHLPNYKKYLRFINNHIFDKPLDDKEFEVVAREEDFTGGPEEENQTADTIMKNHKVCKYNGTVYFYDGDRYYNDVDEWNRLLYNYAPEVKTSYIDEVKKQIDYRCRLIPNDADIPLKTANGVFIDGQFFECEYTDFTPYYVDVEYDPNAEPVKEVDDFIELITDGDEDYKKLFSEVLGHILITDKEVKRMFSKFFFFIGNGGNGKGSLMQVIKELFGKENCSALSIQDMTDERYLNQLNGKLVNLGDDVLDQALKPQETKLLKNLSSCDAVTLRNLYKDAYMAELTASLIFTSNHILKSFEKGFAYARRIVWLPMYNKPKKKETDFISKITTQKALKYWLRIAAEGYFRLYENQEFTTAKCVEQFNDEYHQSNDNTILFVTDLSTDEILGVKPRELYDEYETWCKEEGENPLKKDRLVATVKELKGCVVARKYLNGKQRRVFILDK